MEDLVSIIIPTYKRSDKIERAIKSVINQTYKNIEIIIIDDNANFLEEREKTRKIVRKYKNIKFIENEKNLGGALTRNVGIENATADYVAFLDDDDEFINTKIEKQMELMKQKEKENANVGMIYCYKNIFDTEGKLWFVGKVNKEGNCLFEHMKECIETTSTWLCKKEALIKSGMFENVKAHQDNILLLKILANGFEVYRVPESLVNFYLHGGEGITKKNKNYIEYTKKLIEYKEKYYYLLTKKQIEEIKYCNSSMLLELYLSNKMKKEYFKELLNVLLKNKPRKHTMRLILNLFKL